MNTLSLQNTEVGAVIYITKEISDFQGDWTSWVLKAFVYALSRFQLFETPGTVASQTPQSMGILQTGILECIAMPSSRESSQPGIKHRPPAMQADSLTSEPPGKPKNNGVGSLSLLQETFLTQESKPGYPALQASYLGRSQATREVQGMSLKRKILTLHEYM